MFTKCRFLDTDSADTTASKSRNSVDSVKDPAPVLFGDGAHSANVTDMPEISAISCRRSLLMHPSTVFATPLPWRQSRALEPASWSRER